MIGPSEILRALLAGDPEAARGLLPACRAEAFGAEVFGASAVAELFARQADPLSSDPHVVETERGLAVFDADPRGRLQAVVADLYGGRIGKLWRVGEGERDPVAEPGLTVAVDDFLTQLRDDVAADPADHPEMATDGWAALLEVGRGLAHRGLGVEDRVLQGRAFVVRAFSAGDRAAALFAVRQNVGAVDRQVRQAWAAAAFRFAGGTLTHESVVIDAVPSAPPMPRL